MRAWKLVLGVGVATAAVAGSGAVAQAGDRGPEGSRSQSSAHDTSWHRYHQDDVSYQKGDVCAFAVKGHVLRDKEYYRNVNFWPNDKPRTQLFRGPLVFRWTNQSSGKSVVRDQSGHAYVEYTPQGDLASLNALDGHFGAGLRKGSVPRKGLFYLGGAWTSVVVRDSGGYTLTLGPKGTAENLCRTLG